MKTLLFGVAAIFFLGLLAASFNAPGARPATGEEGVQVKTQRIYESSDTYTIEASYPQVGIVKIDEAVREAVAQAIAEFKLNAMEAPAASAKHEFIGTFHSVYVGPDIVSIELVHSFYTNGAHPNALIEGLTFERGSGKELTLDGALKLVGMSLEEVAAEAKKQLADKLGEAFFAEGAEPTAENYGTFVVNADAVTFIFQNYQAAPYAAGPQAVSFKRI